jgi:hypothetical protein
MTTQFALYLIGGFCAVGITIYLVKFIDKQRGLRLHKLDYWTREFYKAIDEAMACDDVSLAIDIVEVMNDSVASPDSANAWIIVFSKSRNNNEQQVVGTRDSALSKASQTLKNALARCVIAGVMTISYRSMVPGFILRSLMAEFFAEPRRAVEFAGKPDLRSKVRHLIHADACAPG